MPFDVTTASGDNARIHCEGDGHVNHGCEDEDVSVDAMHYLAGDELPDVCGGDGTIEEAPLPIDTAGDDDEATLMARTITSSVAPPVVEGVGSLPPSSPKPEDGPLNVEIERPAIETLLSPSGSPQK